MTYALTTTTGNGTVQDIPLEKLSVWPGNVRKTGAETAIDELAASIAAHGLLNPLTVRPGTKGRFEVVAGQRRLLALRRLVADGALSKKTPIRCSVIEAGQDAGELSLAENVVRVAMHPADQFEAWRDLAAHGSTADDIAVRFGVTALTVKRRMALGRVSPRLLAIYRDGDLSLEALQAYTLTDDHARQEAAYEGLGYSAGLPYSIRHALTEAELPASDRRVRLVGLEAYEAAGGAVRRDLFSEDGGFVQDAALLDRLVRAKLDEAAAVIGAEGWQWVEARIAFDWADRQDFVQAEPSYDEAEDGDEETEPVETWPDAVKAQAGAIVYVAHDGIGIERGLIRQEDLTEDGEDDDNDPAQGGKAETKPGTITLSAPLIEDLTAHRTAALRAELAQQPDKALALMVYNFASRLFLNAPQGILKLSMEQRLLDRSMREEDSNALAEFVKARDAIGERLPGDEAALWEWCFAATQQDLLDVLAILAAHGLDAVVSKNLPNRFGQRQGAALGQELGLEMAQWYRPTALGYFARVSKAVILSDLAAARGMPNAPAWEKLPKGELAALAEREIESTGWLPAPLR